MGRSRGDTTTDRTFIELTHRGGSEDDMGMTKSGSGGDGNNHHHHLQGDDRMSMNSQESKLPFVQTLVPSSGKGMGIRTEVNGVGSDGDKARNRELKEGITKTTTIYHTNE
jgi:hypothetical protein